MGRAKRTSKLRERRLDRGQAVTRGVLPSLVANGLVDERDSAPPRLQARRARDRGRLAEEAVAEAGQRHEPGPHVLRPERLVVPRDIAALAVLLASDRAESISGQMLPVDDRKQHAF
jgi:NAD(P)-dependent dehydrogenase (short-subunit alcohol dehydrogenase family)